MTVIQCFVTDDLALALFTDYTLHPALAILLAKHSAKLTIVKEYDITDTLLPLKNNPKKLPTTSSQVQIDFELRKMIKVQTLDMMICQSEGEMPRSAW